MTYKWDQIKLAAQKLISQKNLDEEYHNRLKFETTEIEKQGAENYWARLFNEGYKYNTNDNGLVLPWILKMTPVDPMTSGHKIVQQTDWPDIDLDCLPDIRDNLKEWISENYGYEKTSSVGSYQTFKFKSAVQDTTRALGYNLDDAIELTTKLPDDVDEIVDNGQAPCVECNTKHGDIKCPNCGCEDTDGVTIGQAIADNPNLEAFRNQYPDIIENAVKLVGKIRTTGKHAGGFIISDHDLMGNIPLGKSSAHWVSHWSEGRNPQLSKFGYVKWDILGLRTLKYIHEACCLIEKMYKVKFDSPPWKRMNPNDECAGIYKDSNGNDIKISIHDKAALKVINELRTETIFQFETDVQDGILANGVRNFYDLQIYNALGHPGPIKQIPEYVKRRDDKSQSWKQNEHPEIAELLEETYGVPVYQEQVAALMTKFGGFTAPEAEAARKAFSKKWKHKLKGIEEQWKSGASKTIGKKHADRWWDLLESFARYSFNRSHSISYIMVAYWCLWLKTHYPTEWWPTVMSFCHREQLIKYMNVARYEGLKFGHLNINNLTKNFTVDPETRLITLGLISIKNIGEKAADKICGENDIRDVDDFVTKFGKSKTIIQRLIHLGAFTKYHKNIKATWMWYQYKYCTGKRITKIRGAINDYLLNKKWPTRAIKEERERQAKEFKNLYPNRKIPKKIIEWRPKYKPTREDVMSIYKSDYSLRELLNFQKEYLGYYWDSPMDLYRSSGRFTIEDAKKGAPFVEAFIESISQLVTKNNNKMLNIIVNDGLQTASIKMWQDDIAIHKKTIQEGKGYKIPVEYHEKYKSFNFRGAFIVPLESSNAK